MKASVSIIICTRNRASGLARTLATLEQCSIPPEWDVEAVVVDNGSTDSTATVLRETRLSKMVLRQISEPKTGLSRARNTGMAQAQNDILLFMDDDILPKEDWVIQLAFPIAQGDCDAATGLVTLDPSLLRPWMTPTHRGWLASSFDAQVPGAPVSLVGANMGFSRSVLDRVPAFDPELGAGALGSSEDTLFGLQLVEAGFRVCFNGNARVTHALDKSRLLRKTWLRQAMFRGHTEGYLLYHWYHARIENPRQEFLSYWLRLKLRRVLQPPCALEAEGCAPWEMSYVLNMAKCTRYRMESRWPRIYLHKALRRLDAPALGQAAL